MTLRRIILIHQTLPVLNVQFLQLLLEQSNKLREIRLQQKRGKDFEALQVFNLNVSQLQLPSIDNSALIDAYETAFSYEIMDHAK